MMVTQRRKRMEITVEERTCYEEKKEDTEEEESEDKEDIAEAEENDKERGKIEVPRSRIGSGQQGENNLSSFERLRLGSSPLHLLRREESILGGTGGSKKEGIVSLKRQLFQIARRKG
ncbi:hypothetical protein L873DRAFT_363894 [Choiromyces venosus 120613-1]|uniref:Uncharacterized protein n=1 Tax=Choiromyces venosus 120613-1 TaxID=1336337 RepID=A0A3N4K093_9PEZI|nr:hypothetical protein L873DRAFT_363894 [Choiromyces venosus 120613-1]